MATNDVTGARLISKIPTAEYRANYAKIFGPKIEPIEPVEESEPEKCRYCGITIVDPCEYLPSDYCEKAMTKFYKETNE